MNGESKFTIVKFIYFALGFFMLFIVVFFDCYLMVNKDEYRPIQ